MHAIPARCPMEGCTQPPPPHAIYCYDHVAHDPDRIRRRTQRARAAGLCPTCRRRKPRKGRKTCTTCIRKATARRAQWRKDGKCVDCRNPSVSRRCPECHADHDDGIRYRKAHPGAPPPPRRPRNRDAGPGDFVWRGKVRPL